jgi:hypothetical protein
MLGTHWELTEEGCRGSTVARHDVTSAADKPDFVHITPEQNVMTTLSLFYLLSFVICFETLVFNFYSRLIVTKKTVYSIQIYIITLKSRYFAQAAKINVASVTLVIRLVIVQ